MCLDLLVEYIEDVETLYGLPSAIKVRLLRGALSSTLHNTMLLWCC